MAKVEDLIVIHILLKLFDASSTYTILCFERKEHKITRRKLILK